MPYFSYKKPIFDRISRILRSGIFQVLIILLFPSGLSAISLVELTSNTDHTRLTANPASLGGIDEGIFQSQLSPCRPFISLENSLTGGFSDQEKGWKLGGNKFLELGSCIPIRGQFESNKGRINFNYEEDGNNDVEYAAWSSIGGSLADYQSNKNSEKGQTLIRYGKQDFITDSVQIGYGWENFGLGLRVQSNAEWQLEGTFFPEVTSLIGDRRQGEIFEWREENIVGLGFGVFFGLDLLGPVQLGYRANKHYYRHEYHFSENGRIVDDAGIEGEGVSTSFESGILLPKFFKYFSLAASNYYFPSRPDGPENQMNFSGGTISSITFDPNSYTVLGLGMDFGSIRGGFGFNLEDSVGTGAEDFSKSIRTARLRMPITDLHYGEKTTSYAAIKIKESTLEASIPYVQIGYKQYEMFVRQSLGEDFQSVGKVAYPTVTLTAYFGPRGMFEPPPREPKNPQTFPNRSARRSSLEALANPGGN